MFFHYHYFKQKDGVLVEFYKMLTHGQCYLAATSSSSPETVEAVWPKDRGLDTA